MIIMKGKVHQYLSMTIDYSSPGKLISSMINYIGNILDNISEDMRGESATPATHHLLKSYVRIYGHTNTKTVT